MAAWHPELPLFLVSGEPIMRQEDQLSISEWADATFRPVVSNIRVAARANEEMAELLRALTVNDDNPKAAEEIADILIVLYRLATRLGVDLHNQVNEKMVVNRSRTWSQDGSGHGYHVRPKP
jgi:NTP pyrophosphatase (non-canonical NTP hydrolase)